MTPTRPNASPGARRPVVITGAGRGIGRAVTLAFAERGLDCVLVGRPSPHMLQTLEECRGHGVAAHHVACDLADLASIDSAAAQICALGTPIALINNAGIVERARLETLQADSLHRQMNTNLLGPIWMARALLPGMRAAGSGRIINLGSISATLGSASQIAYNASKWGLTGFTKSLAQELSGSQLMTVVVHPGGVRTDMTKDGPFPATIAPEDVALTLVHFALDAPLAHNGAAIEMFGA